MKKKYTSEELTGIIKQPEDTCPHLNNIIKDIQSMISTNNISKIEDIKEHFTKADNVFKRIVEWSEEWNSLYLKNEKLDDSKVFYDAAKNNLKIVNLYNTESLKLKILDLVKNDISSIIEASKDYHFSNTEKKENSLLLNMKRDSAFKLIENYRTVAINRRSYGNHIKKAYKDISIMNDFYDVFQPVEYLSEQNSNKNTYLLGIKDSEPAYNTLIKDNIITESDFFILSKMDLKNKDEIIFDLIKKEGFDNVLFYESISDFKTDKSSFKNKELIKQQNKNIIKI